MSYLLDTNILSELVKQQPNKKVLTWFDSVPNTSLYISVLTIGEIRKGIEKVQLSDRRQILRTWLEHALPDQFKDRILSIDQPVADKWGWLQNQIKCTIPAIDGLIAATALHHDLCLVTRNEKDFDFEFLEIINPFK